MKNSFTGIIAASLISLVVSQVGAATVTGTIQATRDSSRSINGAFVVTEKRDATGKPIALILVMDENGRAIAQQYENKQVKIEGNIQGRNLTADTWKEVRDNSYSSSSYESSSSGSSREESYEEPEEEEEEAESKKKIKKNSNRSKKLNTKESGDDEDSESDEEFDEDEENTEEEEDSDAGEDPEEGEEKDDNDESEENEDSSDEE